MHIFRVQFQICSWSAITLAATLFVMLTLPPAPANSQLGPTVDHYPVAKSKKGLLVEIWDDVSHLGVKHAAVNVNLSQLIDPQSDGRDPDQPKWTAGGKTYYFKNGPIKQLDQKIKPLSDQSIVVHSIILVYESKDPDVDRIMLHPGYDHSTPNRLSAFNTQTDPGRRWLAATLEFLANRWSRPDQKFGRVAGYIIGNEVNSHRWWSNMGRVTMQQFADQYLVALRMAHTAIRGQSTWARVYVSLDHHWNIHFERGDDQQSFAGRPFLDYLSKKCREDDEGDFDWHVAFHPYPENLFKPQFWNDKTALPTPETPRVTFKNLSVLTDYLKSEPLLYQGQPRRVILSEQGFHTPAGADGEAIQAAAYCLAYRIAEANEGVDAFILHRHVDHLNEGGLKLGLRRNSPNHDRRPTKLIYDCFRLADTPQWESAFEFALPFVGIENWNLN